MATRYQEVAELAASEAGEAVNNVVVGLRYWPESQLVRLKPPAHYGHSIISGSDRAQALRAAGKLAEGARESI